MPIFLRKLTARKWQKWKSTALLSITVVPTGDLRSEWARSGVAQGTLQDHYCGWIHVDNELSRGNVWMIPTE